MPMRCGISGSVTAVKPRAALRRISVGGLLGVGEVRDAHRHHAVGMLRVPLVEEPVVPRLRDREAELGVAAPREHRAAEAGDLRREVHRRPHAVDVHVADARVDVVAARCASPRSASARPSSPRVLRPTTALSPTWKKILPSNCQTSWPSSVSTTLGASVLQLAPGAGLRTCAAARRGGRRWRRACSGSARGSGSGEQPVRLALAPVQPDRVRRASAQGTRLDAVVSDVSSRPPGGGRWVRSRVPAPPSSNVARVAAREHAHRAGLDRRVASPRRSTRARSGRR